MIELTHERLLARAAAVGPATVAVVEHQRLKRRHPEEALRANLGILRLARDFTPEALEAAAGRALELKVYSYRALRALIAAKAVEAADQQTLVLEHENVRGEQYFQ